MAKRKPGLDSETPTLLKYFQTSSCDAPDDRTEEESPLSPVHSYPSVRSPGNSSGNGSEESPVITERRPSAESSCSCIEEVSPPVIVIDMESEDSRHAELPTIFDATTAGSGSVGQLNDIGLAIKLGMSADEAARAVNALSNGKKYKLLTNHFQPSSNFPFPKVFSNGCNRQFQHKWLSKYPWLVYSKVLKGGFCKFCSLFAANRAQHL